MKKRMNVSKQASTGSYDYGTASFTVSAPLPDETAVRCALRVTRKSVANKTSTAQFYLHRESRGSRGFIFYQQRAGAMESYRRSNVSAHERFSRLCAGSEHLIPTTYSGVPLIIDFGVIDISTCAPMADTFVEVWSGG